MKVLNLLKFIPMFFIGLFFTYFYSGNVGNLFPYVFILLATYIYFESFEKVNLMNEQLSVRGKEEQFTHLKPSYLILVNLSFTYFGWLANFVGHEINTLHFVVGCIFLFAPLIVIGFWFLSNKNTANTYIRSFK